MISASSLWFSLFIAPKSLLIASNCNDGTQHMSHVAVSSCDGDLERKRRGGVCLWLNVIVRRVGTESRAIFVRPSTSVSSPFSWICRAYSQLSVRAGVQTCRHGCGCGCGCGRVCGCGSGWVCAEDHLGPSRHASPARCRPHGSGTRLRTLLARLFC